MNSNHITPISDLGSLPFIIGESETPSYSGFPDVLPFVVGVRPDTSLIVQVPNTEVQNYVEKAYGKGGVIGTPMANEGIGRGYADDFLGFISRALSPGTLKGQRVLEIGCGTGYLLSRINELGAEVLGVEPGERGQIGASKYGIKVLHGMFPHEQISADDRFEVIVTYGVVEHVVDPIPFLEAQVQYLSESGVMIFAVPDSTDCILAGDVSMFAHEHWSYFSAASLKETIEHVGLRLLSLERSGFGGLLYCVAERTGDSVQLDYQDLEPVSFESRMKNAIEHARQYFDTASREASSVGIFCAARALNLLHILQPENSLRFFDDDLRLHGKYYPPFKFPVESRASLLNKPVDDLIIMSRSFGTKLMDELQREEALRSVAMKLPHDVLGS
jgi:2-polyprenyl-3-methyl-5-hydroxy-6-metoxy-1,4-benzoquinol methylase